MNAAKLNADWSAFNVKLNARLAALAAEGIVYRLPPPGGRITGGVLEANVAYGDLVVEYRETGGGWKRYYGAVAVKAPVALRSVSPHGKRVSRTVGIQ